MVAKLEEIAIVVKLNQSAKKKFKEYMHLKTGIFTLSYLIRECIIFQGEINFDYCQNI